MLPLLVKEKFLVREDPLSTAAIKLVQMMSKVAGIAPSNEGTLFGAKGGQAKLS